MSVQTDGYSSHRIQPHYTVVSNPRHALQRIEFQAVTQVSVHKPVLTDVYSSHRIQPHYIAFHVKPYTYLTEC